MLRSRRKAGLAKLLLNKPMRIDSGQPKTAKELDPSLDTCRLHLTARQEMLKLLEQVYPWQVPFEL